MEEASKSVDWQRDFNLYLEDGFHIDGNGVLTKYVGMGPDVVIPYGVVEIADEAFKGNVTVLSVTIPDSVERIGALAFYRCSGLKTLRVGSGVKRIAQFAFAECASLEEVVYHGSRGAWRSIGKSAGWKDGIGKYQLKCLGSTTGIYASKPLDEKQMRNLLEQPEPIPDMPQKKVSKLRGSLHIVALVIAFLFVLVSVAIFVICSAHSLQFFRFNPFALITPMACAVLFAVLALLLYRKRDKDWYKNGNGIFTIVSLALICITYVLSVVPCLIKEFDYGDGYDKGYIYVIRDDDTVYLKYTAFRSFYYKDVEIPSEVDGYTVTEIGNDLYRSSFRKVKVKSITIPSTVHTIGEDSFSGCSDLAEIKVDEGNNYFYVKDNCLIEKSSKTLVAGCKNSIIPTDGSVNKIGKAAFFGRKGMPSEVTIPESVKTIGEYAFCNSDLSAVTISDGVRTIELKAFRGTRLTEITIPESVASIRSSAFSNCNSLKTITLYGVPSVDSWVFEYCKEISKIDFKGDLVQWCSRNGSNSLLDSVPSTEVTLFIGGVKVVGTLTIPNEVEYIASSAFKNCSGLRAVIVTEGVRSIDSYAFAGCKDLVTVTIPHSVYYIGSCSFSGCAALTSIEYQGTMAEWQAISKSNDSFSAAGSFTVHCTDGDIEGNS